jgi:diguanylate cyclase (GGDEF)-like protein
VGDGKDLPVNERTMLSRLSLLVLGPPGRKRLPVLMTALTTVIYGLFCVMLQVEVRLGFIDAHASAWLTAYAFAGSLMFYILVRSGLSERLSSDPSLMVVQIAHGALAVAWGYAITGPTRGALMAVLILIMTYGMFGRSVAQSRWLALFAASLLTATVGWKCHTDPANYVPEVEGVYLAFELIALLGVMALSVRMGNLREQMRTQKLALENSFERIRLLATQDELTGLPNRRHMLALLKAEQSRRQRSEQPMSLVLLDLDHFKRINDNYGHQAGDVVLMGFADAARGTLRGSDVLSRWGGEEFLLMFPETGLDEAERCVDRMREVLAGVSFDSIAPNLKVSFSAGVSVCLADDSLDAAIERADAALYRAKARGRNCTVLA